MTSSSTSTRCCTQPGRCRGADIRGPYVLAGHSFGGMLMRLYATTYPREVAGLISIDAQSEWFAAAFKRLLTRARYTSYVVYTPPPPGFEHYPDYERLSLDASGAEMRQAQADTPLRQMPLVVLSHSPTDPNPFGFPSDFPIRAMNQAAIVGPVRRTVRASQKANAHRTIGG